MYIKKIEWIDKENKEAILKVVNGNQSMISFACPCVYSVGDTLTNPLECIDTENVVLCKEKEEGIEKLEGVFNYRLKGRIKDKEDGIFEVYGFCLHIDKNSIPKDIEDGEYIQFTSSRIDVW